MQLSSQPERNITTLKAFLKVNDSRIPVQFIILTVFCQISVHTNRKIIKQCVTSSISAVINTDVAFKAGQEQHGAQAQHMTQQPSTAREKFHAKSTFYWKKTR